MIESLPWRRVAAVFLAGAALLLGACSTPPAFQVSEPSARVGTVISITQDSVQNVNSGVGTVGGALVGGGIGSLFGGGSGQTVATVVGAVGGVRYDDGSVATVQQTTAPALRIGDRVRVTNTGIELLK